MNSLKELRIKKGFTLEDMAEKLEISTTGYYYYEEGIRKVPAHILDRMAEILGEEVREIFLPSTFAKR